jgi:hypothetical protein
MLKIYCVHPISGLCADDVFTYYEETKSTMEKLGYDVFVPMFGKGFMRTETEFKAHDYSSPLTKNHSIFNRDKWMVKQSDILYANFMGAKNISIGSMMELAWGSDSDKQVVVVMEEDNVHMHAFVLEAATIVFHSEAEALEYLRQIIQKDFN